MLTEEKIREEDLWIPPGSMTLETQGGAAIRRAPSRVCFTHPLPKPPIGPLAPLPTR